MTCIWSKCVDTSLHGHSWQTPQQNHCRISKTWLRYANNRPGTGTSHIIGRNLLAKFGVTQTVNAKFCEFFSSKVLKLHRRTGRGGRGARGAAAPPKFGQLRFFGQQEEIWAKPVFKDVSMFLLLSHDEFLVIREGYHMLIFCCCCWALYFTVLAGVGYFQS